MEEEDIILNDIWTLYFHDPNDDDWTYGSYKKLGDITSVNEYWTILSLLKDKLAYGMFFLMREYIFPCWDDDNNIKGGCLSLKVLKHDVENFWKDICIKILGETFLKEEYNCKENWNLINGVSASPKKSFCIINIWIKSSEISDPRMFYFPSYYQGEVKYRSNQQKIDENHNRLDTILKI